MAEIAALIILLWLYLEIPVYFSLYVFIGTSKILFVFVNITSMPLFEEQCEIRSFPDVVLTYVVLNTMYNAFRSDIDLYVVNI